MKQSHRRIVALLRQGCWLKSYPWSYKTECVMRGSRLVCTVRRSTIREMVQLGTLTLQNYGGVTAYRPREATGDIQNGT